VRGASFVIALVLVACADGSDGATADVNPADAGLDAVDAEPSAEGADTLPDGAEDVAPSTGCPTEAPTLLAVLPDHGSPDGGDEVTLEGTCFTLGASVYFGARAATQVHVRSTTEITLVTPPGDPGPVSVRVELPAEGGALGDLAVVLGDGFTYAP